MDVHASLIHALAGLGLKPRSTEKIIATLKAKGIECSSEGGLLALRQGDTVFSVGQLLISYVEQNPLDFYGHAGEVKYKSDLPDTGSKVAYIKKFGQKAWNELPFNDKSPAAANVVTPVIAHAGMTKAQWLQLTAKERIAFISSHGDKGVAMVEQIMARR